MFSSAPFGIAVGVRYLITPGPVFKLKRLIQQPTSNRHPTCSHNHTIAIQSTPACGAHPCPFSPFISARLEFADRCLYVLEKLILVRLWSSSRAAVLCIAPQQAVTWGSYSLQMHCSEICCLAFRLCYVYRDFTSMATGPLSPERVGDWAILTHSICKSDYYVKWI